jgi:hypothetical protein
MCYQCILISYVSMNFEPHLHKYNIVMYDCDNFQNKVDVLNHMLNFPLQFKLTIWLGCKLTSLYKQKPNKTHVFKSQLFFEKWRSVICQLNVIIMFLKWKHLDLPTNTFYIVIQPPCKKCRFLTIERGLNFHQTSLKRFEV